MSTLLLREGSTAPRRLRSRVARSPSAESRATNETCSNPDYSWVEPTARKPMQRRGLSPVEDSTVSELATHKGWCYRSLRTWATHRE